MAKRFKERWEIRHLTRAALVTTYDGHSELLYLSLVPEEPTGVRIITKPIVSGGHVREIIRDPLAHAVEVISRGKPAPEYLYWRGRDVRGNWVHRYLAVSKDARHGAMVDEVLKSHRDNRAGYWRVIHRTDVAGEFDQRIEQVQGCEQAPLGTPLWTAPGNGLVRLGDALARARSLGIPVRCLRKGYRVKKGDRNFERVPVEVRGDKWQEGFESCSHFWESSLQPSFQN